ncbi:hypothetical protein V6W80_15145 [Pseudomonas benzopyrenica]|uniref:Uncharacterized protein n=1 Tax=Pseudomonas benzopyrenica TaxID=2993566 RepID=A0ABZ2FJP9_9PSED
MPIKTDFSGIKQLQQNLSEIASTTQVPFLDLMSPSFISAHSRFDNFDSFARAAGYEVSTQEDLLAIPDEPWDEFVRQETSFADWNEMQHRALGQYLQAKLHQGL